MATSFKWWWDNVLGYADIALSKIIGNLNSDKYIELLQSYAVPLIKMSTDTNFISYMTIVLHINQEEQ